MSHFFNDNTQNNISVNVRVDKFNSFELPRDASAYEWQGIDAPLHCVNVECTGLDNPFPIDLHFLDGLTDQELKEVRDLYEIGKVLRVSGNFFVSTLDDNKWVIIITDPVASYLPKIVVDSLEETMDATYLPQQTLESMYELPE